MPKRQSKIEKLIAELCPEGVEVKSIGKICQINRGRVMSKDYLRDNAGEYPVYSSQTVDDGVFGRINTYDYDGEYLTWTTDGANAGSIFYRNGKFSITNVCGLLKVKDDGVNTKFLLYILATVSKKYVSAGMGNPKIMSNVMEKIQIPIPIPPLAIQQEIVKILDTFTTLEAELEAELNARRKQYEYYRGKLLTFKEKYES
jgi:type I restriction enzyme S subunit